MATARTKGQLWIYAHSTRSPLDPLSLPSGIEVRTLRPRWTYDRERGLPACKGRTVLSNRKRRRQVVWRGSASKAERGGMKEQRKRGRGRHKKRRGKSNAQSGEETYQLLLAD
eukprot:1037427-Pleurochrysis_carterae.AAC.1